MSEFFIGQKVVCIDDAPRAYVEGFLGTVPVIKDEIYIIRWVGIHNFNTGEELGVRLRGVRRDSIPRGTRKDIPMAANRFLPLEYKAISIFRAIAANPNIKIREDA